MFKIRNLLSPSWNLMLVNRRGCFQKNRMRQEATEKFEQDKKNLQWRSENNEWYSKFKLFTSENQDNSDLITWMQQPMDASPNGIKNWFRRRKEKYERQMQGYIPERFEILGNDLAAAHFLVHRGGSVRFSNSKEWIKMDEKGNYTLPSRYDATYILEAIKCDNMELYYEGLENVRRLNGLKFLSFRNVERFDDWCLDRVSGSEFTNLEILDLSGTNITERGLVALYRISTLKLLILDDPKATPAYELTCAMLEELFANLKIMAVNDIH